MLRNNSAPVRVTVVAFPLIIALSLFGQSPRNFAHAFAVPPLLQPRFDPATATAQSSAAAAASVRTALDGLSVGTSLARAKGSTASWSSALLAASTSDSTTSPPHTVQILMSDTGGGHRASANALRDALDTLHPDQFACDIVDIYTDYGPFWPYNDYVRCYKIMAEYDFLWKAFYEFGCTPLGLWLNEFFLELFCFSNFKDCMGRPTPLGGEGADANAGRRADMVVSVHPLCQDVPLKILTSLDTDGKSRTAGRTTPFATVVTDLGGAHPTWFNPGVNKCYVPSDALYKAALDRKVSPDQIVEYGLPIRKGFWSENKAPSSSAGENVGSWFGKTFGGGGGGGAQKNKAAIRSELGLTQSIPTVLIVGGGDGMGGIVEQAKALGAKLNADADVDSDGPSFQMVVVCGNNEKAQKVLGAEGWGSGVDVKVMGFVYNMDEYMRASDAIVTKAGPGTIAEASICGLPCMLSSFLPGQEEGNVPYVEENGFGTYSGDPKQIAETVSTWLETPEMLASMKKAALDAARPSATLDIARDLADMMFEHKGIVKK